MRLAVPCHPYRKRMQPTRQTGMRAAAQKARPALAAGPYVELARGGLTHLLARIDRASSIISATIRAAGLTSRMWWTPSPAGNPKASKFPVVSGVGGKALKAGMGTPGVSNVL